jgi:UDPglucose--hexose-1-phosphate uridylyltransferase
MSELRRHYFLEEYCLIAAERNKRPSDFKAAKTAVGDEAVCPFCPGNESLTPPGVAAYSAHGVLSEGSKTAAGWQIRVFPNAFAAVTAKPAPSTPEWIALPGKGSHEVIVDSPLHRENPADFSRQHMENLIWAYRDRYAHYRSDGLVKYVSVFKNWGMEAGASISHSHSQLITLPIMPPLIKRELSAFKRASFCPFCHIVEQESRSSRLIDENGDWILIAPFYSEAPYEMWIMPRRHLANLEDMNEAEGRSLAAVLKQALGNLRCLLSDPPYNYMIFQLPSRYHLNIRIQPAVSKMAGFERATGIRINAAMPEVAAKELRDSCRVPKS